MNNWILTSLITLIFLSQCIKAQQKYSGNAVLNCNQGPFLYKCNGNYPCQAFLIFTAKFPYNTVPAIAALTSSGQAEIAKINKVTQFSSFSTNQEVIIPVNCSCSGEYYQASTMYHIPNLNGTYHTIAHETYQGLSTCDSIKRANEYSEFDLLPGHQLEIPLRCACPTRGQTVNETKFLMTYSIGFGDTLYALSKRFNVSIMSITKANSIDDEYSTIYPFTTILVPLPSEPSSSQTVTRGYKLNDSHLPLPAPVFRKSRVKRVFLTAGIATGALSLLIFVIIIPLFLFRKKRTRVQQSGGRNANKMHSQEDLIVEIARIDRALKVFNFSEIKKATRNFRSKNRIKGCVYHGTFGRETMAVKKINGNAQNEVKLLYQINHFNIVKLHGFCEHKGDSYLFYEYMKNGSLQDWLRRRGSKDAKSWNRRIQIALDVANGLLYLHNFTKQGYVHNDIRSSNILLDGNLRAKIANFSKARTANIDDLEKRVVGTTEYMAPEWQITSRVDIFAFGVVLLELITGKYPVLEQDGKEKLLSMAIIDIMESQNAESELSRFIEPGLAENGGIKYAIQMVKLSLSCLKQNPEDRPDIVDIVSVLSKMQYKSQKPVTV